MSQANTVHPATGLRGEITVPGDKSISHRSIILGSLSKGVTLVHGFLHGEDNYATLNAFRAMGIAIEKLPEGDLRIFGRGLRGLSEPADVIDCGNSGTTIRLMAGLLAGQSFFSVLTGDRYLRKRPMRRVAIPLTTMGARIWGRHGGELAPLAILGRPLKAISYDSPIASAQVKSALLLAGLYADGITTIREPYQSRDHSERMLAYFGADIRTFAGGVSVEGQPQLEGREVFVPGDISSAAFFMVAALITPHSELLIRNVGLNPTRSGVIDILQQMGGYVEVLNKRELSGEAVADILIKSSTLKGIEIGGAVVPRAIDEFPVISVAATFAEGNTIIRDARELRVKETDRIAAMTTELGKLGGLVEARDDGMLITGVEQLNGGSVTSQGDHRVAMSLVVAALRAASPVTIDDTGCVGTSFPNFWDLLKNVKT
jgi:3-phosphoshikimate 1-carboxyvinyltransferase